MKRYIDAEKLKAEITRHYVSKARPHQNEERYYMGLVDCIEMIERIIDSLQPYDEAYLQEKIALKEKNGSWKDGIKQLEHLNKVYFPTSPEKCEEVDLEKEIDKTVNECTDGYNFDWDKFAKHFYELGKQAKKEEYERFLDKVNTGLQECLDMAKSINAKKKD